MWDSYAIHSTRRATAHKIKRGCLGVLLEKAAVTITRFVNTCVRCNAEAKYRYTVNMGASYAGLATLLPLMSQVSVDILGHIDVVCFSGSNNTYKVFLLVIADLNVKALHIESL